MAGENHFSRMLFGAGIALDAHRMTRLGLLFRKPFFPGDGHAILGSLWQHEARTLMTAAIHPLGPDGEPAHKPAVGIRCEGLLSPE